ncbi:hypothetical protein AVEN_173216-1 [Araneus ventricosus]|uniref:Uncharacterized protein n=1 Tax=Araneus ventricosus TaxID=182803 RepID=A0A4Y2PCN8_ARAVE|nr:hypothetical protein AVEN_173216-1 [Araneus ventricosus]
MIESLPLRFVDSHRERGVLVVRSRLRSRRVPGSKPDFTGDPPCLWTQCKLNMAWFKCPLAGEVRKFGEADASSLPLQSPALSSDRGLKLRG